MKIKSKPTVYAGVRFRSRLEAKWAAFFDLMGFNWEYEPTEEFGDWIPDFKIATKFGCVFVEVKPKSVKVPTWYEGFEDYPAHYENEFNHCDYDKARNHWREVHVLLLGVEPDNPGIGCLMDRPDSAKYDWDDIADELGGMGNWAADWRKAGNMIQWRPPTSD